MQDSNANENVTENITSFHLRLRHDYFNSLNFYTNDKLPRNQISRSGVQVKKKKKMKNSPSCVSVLHKTLNLFHITVLQRTAKPGNVPKLKMHVQRDCFCSLRLLFCGVVIAAAIMFS